MTITKICYLLISNLFILFMLTSIFTAGLLSQPDSNGSLSSNTGNLQKQLKKVFNKKFLDSRQNPDLEEFIISNLDNLTPQTTELPELPKAISGVTGNSGDPIDLKTPNTSNINKINEKIFAHPETEEAYKKFLIAKLKYETDRLEQSSKNLSDQLKSISNRNDLENKTFIVLMIFLIICMLVAILEYWKSRTLSYKENDGTDLKISMEGIALKTKLHGTLLLVVAIVLFFVFLKFLFQVQMVTL